jgi:hypothetical protein
MDRLVNEIRAVVARLTGGEPEHDGEDIDAPFGTPEAVREGTRELRRRLEDLQGVFGERCLPELELDEDDDLDPDDLDEGELYLDDEDDIC